ncbi:MAG TPA: SusC/RagA family TonB-linked outer membrane protein, partial [Algoriphagus sp.]
MRRVLLGFVLLMMNASLVWAQSRTVTGKVTSKEDPAGIPGLSVVVKGTTQGTVTDLDGNYSLSVPSSDAVLVFSFVGLRTKEVPVENKTVINVVMESDVKALEEIVITGQGSGVEKRRLSTTVDQMG